MDNIPKIQLVQLYSIEYDAALRQATKRLLDAREELDASNFNGHKFSLEVELRSASKIVLSIVAAVRAERRRIRGELEYYTDPEAATAYIWFLTHLELRGMYGEASQTTETEKEATCQNQPST